MKIEIKNKYTDKIIVSGKYESVKDCLEKNSGVDLSGADLRGVYLNGADLSGANLSYADLRGANLRGVYLNGADLSGADLRGADLRGANLSRASLSRADINGADLSGANLSYADLRGANLRGVYLNGAYLSDAKFTTKTGKVFTTQKVNQFLGLKWDVYFFDNHMKIGCECHSYADWWKFEDKKIIEMAGKDALEFWKKNKKMLKIISEELKERE